MLEPSYKCGGIGSLLNRENDCYEMVSIKILEMRRMKPLFLPWRIITILFTSCRFAVPCSGRKSQATKPSL